MRNLSVTRKTHTLAALMAACCLLAGIGRSDDTLPKGFDVSRYQGVWERNPFTLVTPTVAQGPASPFSKLILVNWLHDKGKDILFVQDTETNEVKKVTKEAGANSDELRLVEVVPNKNPSLIVAKLSKGREEGVVKFKFDQAQNTQAVNPNFAMQRGVPAQNQMGPNAQQFGVNQPGGPPRRGPQVPGNQPNLQQNPANAPNAQEIRRRRMLPAPAQNQVPPQNQVPQNQTSENPVLRNNAVQSNGQQNTNGAADSDDDDQ